MFFVGTIATYYSYFFIIPISNPISREIIGTDPMLIRTGLVILFVFLSKFFINKIKE